MDAGVDVSHTVHIYDGHALPRVLLRLNLVKPQRSFRLPRCSQCDRDYVGFLHTHHVLALLDLMGY